MNNNVKFIVSALILIASIVAYFSIKTCIPFASEDLTINYYCALMITKALLFGFSILSITIVFCGHSKK